MIQDIAPHVYDNAFASRREPKKNDPLLIFQKNQILMDAKAKKQGQVDFPHVGNLPILPGEDGKVSPEMLANSDVVVEKSAGRYLFRGFELIYLFMIDDIAFYGIDGMEAEFTGCEWTPFMDFRSMKLDYMNFAGITGAQLNRWRQLNHYCGRCGATMMPSLTERAFTCPKCKNTVYPRINPAVIVAVTDGDRIVVTRYAGRGPSKNYALIAGFAEIGEPIEDTVHREVLEEVGLKVKNLRFYKSQPWSFSDTLLMGFYCELDGDDKIRLDEEELALGVWLRRDELPERSNEISLTAEMMEEFRLGRQ